MSNRLADETSPYLLQHKDNPVGWYPWGDEALQRARRENKPIFLSIGYSACHWCHVMERESFENEQIAGQLNQNFIPIKVDREERPDLDQIYMQAVQMMTGHGGWPMSVFLTPQLEPFYGGTYWPPSAQRGMPGFDQVLAGVSQAWRERHEEVVQQAGKLTTYLREANQASAGEVPLEMALLQHAEADLERIFDFTYGGLGGAPKFPHPMALRLLLRMWQRTGRSAVLEMVRLTLDKMAGGGIYDQLGGGFHRYSVDRQWLVPHFEKMLYDNALLAATYVDAFLATGHQEYGRIARETFDYVLREMQHPAGGFSSTQDADSEGVEGKFFVWTVDEVQAALGDSLAKTFCRVYDVTATGNFEGRNILNLPKPLAACAKLLNRDEEELRAELAEGRRRLFAVRQQRVAPGLDDKVLVCWNALMIDALARGAGAFDQPRYVEAAVAAADFIWQNMRREDGRLLHTWRNGQARLDAYLDDYAALLNACVSLYEATFDEQHVDRGLALADLLLAHFVDPQGGGLFYTASDHEPLIARQKDLTDNAVPGGNGLAATGLLRLARLTGRPQLAETAIGVLQAAAERMREFPSATGQLLLALEFHLDPGYELVLVGDASAGDTGQLLAELRHQFLPHCTLACRRPGGGGASSPALDEIFRSRDQPPAVPTLYVCQNTACRAPAVGLDAARAAVKRLTEIPSAGATSGP